MSTSIGCRKITIIADEYASTDVLDSDTPTILDSDTATDTENEIDSQTETETETEIATDTEEYCSDPESFSWSSTGPLILPPSNTISIKDPTVVLIDGLWHVYATVKTESSYSMVYLSFADWSQAGTAEKTLVSVNQNLTGYKAAPQLFYFAPQKLWYLVYQSPEPSYSTSTNPKDVNSWSAMKTFMNRPDIIPNDDRAGIDFWVICDDTYCYLFFSALNDVLYRAQTLKSSFPEGFGGTTKTVMQDSEYHLYDASNVYRLKGTDTYLLLVEAIGQKGRYFRAWTSDHLDGAWTPLATEETNAFASLNNVTGADWSDEGIVHGEMLRTNLDETMTIDACDLRYLYSGHRPAPDANSTDYYVLGLLTDAR